MSEKPIGVAVLGLGNVGSEVVRIIEESAALGLQIIDRGSGDQVHK